MIDPKSLLQPLEEVSLLAGDILMRHFRNLDGYERKGAVDLVTVADKEAEDAIVAYIKRHFPGHGILGEEGGEQTVSNNGVRWIIDPLDGTTNFAHGMRQFAVSIGIMDGEEIVAGCVHAPSLEETFLAVKGNGATLNGKSIRVSTVDNPKDALTVTGFPYERAEQLKVLKDMLGEILLATQGALRLGSAALDLAHVAAGHLDVFYEAGLNPWDQAAGMILVTEAGGKVTGMRRNIPGHPFTPEVLATNGIIHEAVRDLLYKGGVETLFD
ncbi:MAG: inositol monophosphatase [Candidatus Sumerlaeia bacterium]|nr:inositol monophosphatase [Candidatus Sumerlaeia bacterium]